MAVIPCLASSFSRMCLTIEVVGSNSPQYLSSRYKLYSLHIFVVRLCMLLHFISAHLPYFTTSQPTPINTQHTHFICIKEKEKHIPFRLTCYDSILVIMAMLSQPTAFPMRPKNKEPDWSVVYDDLFNQYIDTEHLDLSDYTDSSKQGSSPTSSNHKRTDLIDFSTTACQSGSSPSLTWDAKEVEQDFWTRTVQSLEKSAKFLECQKQRSRAQVQRVSPSTSHADFLSLGGCPSPYLPKACSSSEAAIRRRSTDGPNRQAQAALVSESSKVHKVYRNASKSPKMMSPSRYRGASRGARMDKTEPTTMAMVSAPISPPYSARINHVADVAPFGSFDDVDTIPFHSMVSSESQRCPVSNGYSHNGTIYTPESSPPLINPRPRQVAADDKAYDQRSIFYAVPATAPHNGRSSWNLTEAENDYELSPKFNPWGVSSIPGNGTTCEIEGQHGNFHEFSPLSPFHSAPLDDLSSGGLLIMCDPFMTTFGDIGGSAAEADIPALSGNPYVETGHEAQQSRVLSRTPSPPPRSRRAVSKVRGRRTRSTPRSPHGGISNASFVNLTPSDSAKLLTGVAPSGSSKTKARREKEAAEKRRKFSAAAVRVIADAGGDINRLIDAGIVL